MSPARAAKVLQKIVEPAKTFRWPFSSDPRYFEGSVEEDCFTISRIISYGNSFLPIIEGRFQSEGSNIVTLNMRMAWPVMVFWYGILLELVWRFGGRGFPHAGVPYHWSDA